MMLLSALYVLPAIGAQNTSLITQENDEEPLDVPEEYTQTYMDFLECFLDPNADAKDFQSYIVHLYDGVQVGENKFNGVREDIEAMDAEFGTHLASNLDKIWGITPITAKPLSNNDPKEQAMEDLVYEINDVILSEKNRNDNRDDIEEYPEIFNHVIGDDGTIYDRLGLYNLLGNIKLKTYTLKDYLSNLVGSLKLGENDQLWNFVKLAGKAIWIAVDVGLGAVPIVNDIWALICGFAVSAVVGAGAGIAINNVSIELGKVIRGAFPSYSPLSKIPYEGAITFLTGFVAFLAYFTAFKKVRAVQFMNGAVVALAGVYGVDMVVDEIRKALNQTGGNIPKAMGTPARMPLLRTFLSKLNFNFDILEFLKLRMFSPKIKAMALY